MVVALVVSAVVVVVLAVVVIRLRRRVDELGVELADLRVARDEALAAREAAVAETRAVAGERDDALERVTRSRRDAAEVANRLSAETERREAIEADLAALREDFTAAEAELAAAKQARSAATRDPGGDASTAAALWALQLRQTAHTWRLSISLGSDDACPLDETDDPFRTAVEIEVDAAREEGGAAIDLEWGDGELDPAPAQAALALAVVRDVIAAVGTIAGRTVLRVDPDPGGVAIVVEAYDDADVPIAVELPASLEVEPGRAVVS